jgi:hypothetical protein
MTRQSNLLTRLCEKMQLFAFSRQSDLYLVSLRGAADDVAIQINLMSFYLFNSWIASPD